MSCEDGKDLRVNTIMENGVGKKIVTCDDPSSPPPPPTFCPGFPFCDNQGTGGIETHGSWPGVDTYRNWPFRPYRPWPLMWPGQGYWPGSNIQPHHHIPRWKWELAAGVGIAFINSCKYWCPPLFG